MKNTIGVYANWKPTINTCGYDVLWINEKYISCLQDMFIDVTLLSSSKTPAKIKIVDNDTRIFLYLIPLYYSFIQGHLRCFHLISGFCSLLKNNTRIFVRYPEPLIWVLLLLNLFWRRKVHLHIVSNPLEIIGGRGLFFKNTAGLLLKIDLVFIKFFIHLQKKNVNVSFNGVVVPHVYRKLLSPHILTTIESSFRSNETFSASDTKLHELDLFRLVIVSRAVSGKNLLEFIKMLAELKFSVGDKLLHLTIVGDGPEMATIEEYLSANPNFAKNVVLLGELTDQNEVLTQLHLADCSVISSSSETGPRVFIESLFVGRPVISTNVGYVYDIGRLYKTVFPFELNDPDAFCDSVRLISEKNSFDLEAECKSNVFDFSVDAFFKKVFYHEG